MAISKDSKITYSDIRNLFDKVNAERLRFEYAADTSGIPTQGSPANAATPNKLLSLLKDMKSHTFVGQFATAADSFAAVSRGNTILPGLLQNISRTLDTIEKQTYYEATDNGRCSEFNFCSPYGSDVIQRTCNPYGSGVIQRTCNPYGESGYGTYREVCATVCPVFNFFSRGHFAAYNSNHFSTFSRETSFFGTHFSTFSRETSFFGTHFSTFSRETSFRATCFSGYNSTHFGTFSRETTFFAGCHSGFNASDVWVRLNATFFGRFSCESGFFASCFSGYNSTHFGTYNRDGFCSSGFFAACFSGFYSSHCSSGFFSSCFVYDPDGNGGRCTFCTTSGFVYSTGCDSFRYFDCTSNFHSPYGSGNSDYFTCNPYGSGNSDYFTCNPYGSGCRGDFCRAFNNGFNSSVCVAGFCPSFNGATFFNSVTT